LKPHGQIMQILAGMILTETVSGNILGVEES